MVVIGNRVKRLRLKKGLSQKELSGKAGIAQSYLSQIENGEKSPTLRTLKKLASALEISLEELVRSPEDNRISRV